MHDKAAPEKTLTMILNEGELAEDVQRWRPAANPEKTPREKESFQNRERQTLIELETLNLLFSMCPGRVFEFQLWDLKTHSPEG